MLSILPHHSISHFFHWLTRIRVRWLKNWQIKTFIKVFRVDMSLAVEPDPTAYRDFNSFFTRALRTEVRPVCNEDDGLACPVDGEISQLGNIDGERLLQAKKHQYSLTALMGGSATLANTFIDGRFCTIYLSPKDYHRIHMPIEADLREMTYVPGKLFSVSHRTVQRIPRLFARNERVISIFDTDYGPMAQILVGAINVGSMETVWHGCVTPPYGTEITTWRYDKQTVSLRRGEEMGRFHMGSTVILLFTKDAVEWQANLAAGGSVTMGQCLGSASKHI